MALSEHQEKQRLYSPDSPEFDEESDNIHEDGHPHSILKRRRGLPCNPILIAICLGVFGVSLFVAFLMGALLTGNTCQARIRAYSPASEALVPTIRKFDHGHHNPYMGTPSPEVDGAWTKLLQYSNLRFSESELDAIDPERKYLSAVKLPDGGYFGMLHAYHELHCIKHLRRFLYADYYTPNLELTPEQFDDRRWHLEHCLDALRQGVMCRADVTPRTMRWIHTEPVPGANSSSPHSCNSWESVDKWAKARSIDNIFEPGYLKHPTFGDVYTWDGLEELYKVNIAHDTPN